MAVKRLPETVKIAIVKALAAFLTPSEVVELVKAEYGLETSRQNVEYYDPNKSPDLSSHWCAIFERERARFCSEKERDPLDYRAYRQRIRREQIARNSRNPKLVRELLNDGAKDAGGFFTNKRSLQEAETPALLTSEHVSQLSEEHLQIMLEFFAAHSHLTMEQMKQLTIQAQSIGISADFSGTMPDSTARVE